MLTEVIIGVGELGQRAQTDQGGGAGDDAEGEDQHDGELLPPGHLQAPEKVDGQQGDDPVDGDIDGRVDVAEGDLAGRRAADGTGEGDVPNGLEGPAAGKEVRVAAWRHHTASTALWSCPRRRSRARTAASAPAGARSAG